MGEEIDAVAVVVLTTSVPLRVSVGGRTVLEWVCSALASVAGVTEIVVASQVRVAYQLRAGLGTGVNWCRPDDTRPRAIHSALQAARSGSTVLLHDADQPLVTPHWLSDVSASAADHPAVASGVPVKAAFKRVVDGVIQETVPRDRLVRLLGPRAFRRDVLSEVLDRAVAEGWRCADEVGAARLAGVPVVVHRVADINIRVTDELTAELAGRLAAAR